MTFKVNAQGHTANWILEPKGMHHILNGIRSGQSKAVHILCRIGCDASVKHDVMCVPVHVI